MCSSQTPCCHSPPAATALQVPIAPSVSTDISGKIHPCQSRGVWGMFPLARGFSLAFCPMFSCTWVGRPIRGSFAAILITARSYSLCASISLISGSISRNVCIGTACLSNTARALFRSSSWSGANFATTTRPTSPCSGSSYAGKLLVGVAVEAGIHFEPPIYLTLAGVSNSEPDAQADLDKSRE